LLAAILFNAQGNLVETAAYVAPVRRQSIRQTVLLRRQSTLGAFLVLAFERAIMQRCCRHDSVTLGVLLVVNRREVMR
jgi:hypothetical protein